MLHISFRMILRVPSLGSLLLNILKVSVGLWFEMTSLECFNVRSSSCGWFIGLVWLGTMQLLSSEVVLVVDGVVTWAGRLSGRGGLSVANLLAMCCAVLLVVLA